MEIKNAEVANMLKFFWNGIKGTDGKLQKAFYATDNWITYPKDMIRIYGKNYANFSEEVQDAFEVKDGSDLMSDYFENQHIDVLPTHPLYGQVKEALEKYKARCAMLKAKLAVR